MNNFDFLKERWPLLENLGRLAERNLYIDSNTTFIKCGMFGEILVKYMISMEEVDESLISHDNNHNNRIKLLKKEDLIPEDIDNILHIIRIKRNVATHDMYEDIEKAKVQLELTYKLAVWFMQTYGDWSFEPKPFSVPSKNEYGEDINAITKEYDEKFKALEAELNSLKSEKKDKKILDQRKRQGKIASRKIEYTEAETRRIIDAQLQSAGWEADTDNLRYSKGTRPTKGRNLAISEWPTYSKEKGNNGRVDYALFIGKKLVGFIEAKKYSKDVAGTIGEAKTYAKAIKEEHAEYVVSNWNDYEVPFLFSTNGRKYIKEIDDKSGVHFLDCRNSKNNPKVLHGWYSPESLERMLKEDVEASNSKLDELGFDFLQSSNSIGLRDYQVKAIKAVEQAIKDNKKSALITMATGTGKTRTVLGLIYRLLKTKRYNRILFLVDRTSLGEQALETFSEVKIEDLQNLNQIYNINGLDEKLIDKETKIHIATVQAMVKRIMYNEDENNVPSVGDYDCIIVDEAHRGYTLDKEMSDTEVEWRDNRDFLGKYKKVIEYFDAFKVALTATPALQTTMIFGNPVNNNGKGYSYRDAVIDGYLVDHEPPHLIETELTRDGIHFKKGDTVAKYNKYTKELINGAELEDDLDFEVDSFNRKVIVEFHTRAALEKVTEFIDPENDKGKTLIFAVNDAHADMIVRVLKDIYRETMGGVDDDSILKITGSDKKNQSLYIKKFKNENYPNIAVTVDLLSTGIDVPKIDKIVFLRRVKSRILYEQMLGRATRLCDEIGKTHFEIFDCVRLYETLEDMTNMKPVVANTNTSFKVLKEALERSDDDIEKRETINKIIAKLQRKKKLLKDSEKLIFKSHCNDRTPDEFIKVLKQSKIEKAVDEIVNNNSLIEYLDEKSEAEQQVVIISDEEDKVVSYTRGYGAGKKTEDYLQEFKTYIEENRNIIPALEIVCTKPQDLTKDSLKQLRAVLDKKGFNEEYLKTAWKDSKNEEIVADIIAFIRQQALGSPLESNEERVKRAVARIKKEYTLTKPQENWLNRIEKVMLKEVVIDKETFDTGSFKTQGGGFTRLNTIFAGKLEEIVTKMKTYMFESKENA